MDVDEQQSAVHNEGPENLGQLMNRHTHTSLIEHETSANACPTDVAECFVPVPFPSPESVSDHHNDETTEIAGQVPVGKAITADVAEEDNGSEQHVTAESDSETESDAEPDDTQAYFDRLRKDRADIVEKRRQAAVELQALLEKDTRMRMAYRSVL